MIPLGTVDFVELNLPFGTVLVKKEHSGRRMLFFV